MSNKFPDNKAAELVKDFKDQQGSDTPENEELITSIEEMSRLVQKLEKSTKDNATISDKVRTGNDKLEKTLSELSTLKSGKSTSFKSVPSEIGQSSLDMLAKIAETSKSGSAKEQKALKTELSEMTKFIKLSIRNKDEQKAILQIKDEISNGVEKNSNLMKGFTDAMSSTFAQKALPFIAGTVAGVFADSPIVGIAAGIIAEGAKAVWNRRQAKKQEKRERASLRLQAVQEAHQSKLNEIQSKILDDNKNNSKDVPERDIELGSMESFLKTFGTELVDGIVTGVGQFIDGFMNNIPEFDIPSATINAEVKPLEAFDTPRPSLSNENITPVFDEESSFFNEMLLEENNKQLENITKSIVGISKEMRNSIQFNKKGKEEARREGQFEREQLLAAVENIGKGDGKNKEESGSIMGILEDLGLGGIAAGIAGIGGIFMSITKGVKTIFKVAKKVLLPITAIISVFNGITKGFDKFKETGSILEGVMSGIMGTADSLISMFSFGFLDLDKIGGFLRDVIPTGISDAVFGAVDTVIDFFKNPLESIGKMFSGLGDLLIAPFKAILGFFDIDFSVVTEFFGRMKDTLYEWVASIIPDAVPNWAIPNSILKYKDSAAAVEVAQDNLKSFQADADPYTRTKESLKEEITLRKVLEEAKLKQMEDSLKKENTLVARNAIKLQKEKIERSNDSILMFTRKIEQELNVNTKLVEVSKTNTAGNNIRDISNRLDNNNLIKNERTRIGEVVQSTNNAIQASQPEKSSNVNVNNQSSTVNNNSTTHVNTTTYNRDPSIMQPILN